MSYHDLNQSHHHREDSTHWGHIVDDHILTHTCVPGTSWHPQHMYK